MIRYLLTMVLVTFVLSGCAWVKLTEAGETVSVVGAGQVERCRKIGETRVSVRDRVVAIQRKPGKVAGELERLARNEAAELGGNRIVALGPVLEGTRSYAVFSC